MPGKLLLGDNLELMAAMEPASVDLVYCDPPYNTGREFGAFSDKWTKADIPGNLSPKIKLAVDAAGACHSLAMAGYMGWLSIRLEAIKRILKPSGSVYVHVDPTGGPYVRMMMDAIFGKRMYGNELIWCYKGSVSKTTARFQSKHDVILFYRGANATFNRQFIPHTSQSIKEYRRTDEDGRAYRVNGHGLPGGGVRRYYLDESMGLPIYSWWNDIHSFSTASNSSEIVGYPTQKPIKLLERIVKASSDPGMTVMDPFMGSGTTCVAAERLGRLYIGIDRNPDAVRIAAERLKEPVELPPDVPPPEPEAQGSLPLWAN